MKNRGKIRALTSFLAFLAILMGSIVASSSIASAKINDNLLTLSIALAGQDSSDKSPNHSDPTPSTFPTECVPQSPVPYTPPSTPANPSPSPTTSTPPCVDMPKVGERRGNTTHGTAYWHAVDVVPRVDEGMSVQQRGNPYGMPNGGDGYGDQCKNDMRFMSFQGAGMQNSFKGWFRPNTVNWTYYREWYIDGNHNQVEDVSKRRVTYGSCNWPSVTMHESKCPLWIDNAYLTGPYGKGLPVETSPGVFDPTSFSKKEGKLIAGNGSTKYTTALGDVMGGASFLPRGGGDVSLITGCGGDLAGQYQSSLFHTGNYVLQAQARYAECSWIEFMGAQASNGCKALPVEDYTAYGYRACDGSVLPGNSSTIDFSCPKIDFNVCVEPDGSLRPVSPGQQCPVVKPEEDPNIPVPDPGDGSVQIRVNVPAFNPATEIRCVYDDPVVTGPGGTKIPIMNGAITVPANGKTYLVDWGNVNVRGVATTNNEWTNYFVQRDSSPGDNTVPASSDPQPFIGKYQNKDVLMWSEDKGALGKGVDGPPWAETLNMQWFKASDADKTFTVYQQRNFTWTRTQDTELWDGSTVRKSQEIPQTCESVPLKVRVVTSRNSG